MLGCMSGQSYNTTREHPSIRPEWRNAERGVRGGHAVCVKVSPQCTGRVREARTTYCVRHIVLGLSSVGTMRRGTVGQTGISKVYVKGDGEKGKVRKGRLLRWPANRATAFSLSRLLCSSLPERQLLCDWWWAPILVKTTGRAPQEREHVAHSRVRPARRWQAPRVSEVRGPIGPAARLESVDHWPLAIVDRPDSGGEPLCVSRRSPV